MALTLQEMNPYRIARYIGHATTDIGALCASIKVNRWCPHRPIAAMQDADLTDAQRQALNWGYNIPHAQNLRDLLNAARIIGPGRPCWTSTRPSHANCPYFRFHDFIGYDHGAKAPFGWMKPTEGATIYRSGKIRFAEAEAVGEGQLTQSQFPLLNGLKIGVAIRKIITGDNTNQPAIHTNFTDNIIDFDVDAEEFIINPVGWLSTSNNGTGDYEGCLFFTDQTLTLEGNENSGNYYLLPYGYFTFHYNNAVGISVYGDNIVRNAGGNLSLAFDFHVIQEGEAQPVTGIRIWCLDNSAEGTDWKYEHGMYTTVNGGGLVATSSVNGAPATVQVVDIGTVNVASFNRQVQFAIDGDAFPGNNTTGYTIFAEFAVNGYRYMNDGILDDNPPDPDLIPEVSVV